LPSRPTELSMNKPNRQLRGCQAPAAIGAIVAELFKGS
jgi:hypothetical protein